MFDSYGVLAPYFNSDNRSECPVIHAILTGKVNEHLFTLSFHFFLPNPVFLLMAPTDATHATSRLLITDCLHHGFVCSCLGRQLVITV